MLALFEKVDDRNANCGGRGLYVTQVLQNEWVLILS